MRLLTIGAREGQLAAATKIAADSGASAIHADRVDAAMAMLRSRQGADLLMVDIAIDVRDLVVRLEGEGIQVPIVACGTHGDAPAAMAAIEAGAREYVPLPPDAEMIAAILTAVAQDPCERVYRDESIANRIVGRTVADVERDLILETLKHCLGNRTRAANILGISLRTLRNKLTVYAADGVRVPPPNSGEVRGAA
jgi:DNA-binding NtrC family response regulator